jgi:hypothetical protein
VREREERQRVEQEKVENVTEDALDTWNSPVSTIHCHKYVPPGHVTGQEFTPTFTPYAPDIPFDTFDDTADVMVSFMKYNPAETVDESWDTHDDDVASEVVDVTPYEREKEHGDVPLQVLRLFQ